MLIAAEHTTIPTSGQRIANRLPRHAATTPTMPNSKPPAPNGTPKIGRKKSNNPIVPKTIEIIPMVIDGAALGRNERRFMQRVRWKVCRLPGFLREGG